MASQYDLDEVWRTVERVAKTSGKATDKTVSDGEREMLRFARNLLGTRKPVEEYAPRTRRRYRAASKRGETAAQANRVEYQRRAGKPINKGAVPRNERAQMDDLIRRRNEFFPHELVDREDIEDYVQAFGYDNVVRILKDQIDSCETWIRGDARIGNKRWHQRRWEQLRPDFSSYIANTDILYYYHAARL